MQSKDMKNLFSTVRDLSKTKLIGKKTKTIEGYVERIDALEIHGWVINRKNEPLKLSLRIDKTTHPVSHTIRERADVAASLGNEFLHSGFVIALPDMLVDNFMLARQNGKSVDVFANGVLLRNKSKPSDPATEKSYIDPKLFPADFDFQAIVDLNAEFGIEVTLKDLFKLISGQSAYPIRINRNDTVCADYCFDLAKYHLTKPDPDPDRAKQGVIRPDIHAARTLLKICMSFEKRTEFIEQLGKIYFDEGDYQTAAYYYEEVLSKEDGDSKAVFINLANCKKQLGYPRQAIETLVKGMEMHPEFSSLQDRLDEFVMDFWLKQQGAFDLLSVQDRREDLIERVKEATSFIYHTYLRAYGAGNNPDKIGSCNLNRILIVGDFHITQCVRYRIEQKIEQLEAADKEVTAISWTELAKEQNALVFHDVVIFYRVPAEPSVLKAMAQVNATGKLSLYEIDDLLFDPTYPPPIESYGGYLDLNTYIQIMKGMALFNSAAYHCRFGIASTKLLAEKLQPMVFGEYCFLHRNGIDSLNVFKKQDHSSKETIDIFYGSATMAHNSDFLDLALPAITRILDEYADTCLVVAGYLKLPPQFLSTYNDRVKQIPPVKNVKSYWSLLERADINLAVLEDNDINGCKSELKWFEAACLGIPSVVSSTSVYRDVIRHGEDGLIAASTEDWYQNLKILINDPQRRLEIAENAQLRVQSEYSIEALSDSISALLEQAIEYAMIAERAERKKIALVNVYFPPQSIGGATRVLYDNFDLLQKHYRDQFELCVFTSDAEQKVPHEMTIYNHQGARVYRSTVLWRENMDWYPSDEKIGELFSDFLTAENPDLIHFHCVQRLSASVVEAAKEAEVPYIVTVHDAWWISDYQFLVDANNKVYPDGHPDPYAPHTLPANITMSDSIERMFYLKGLLNCAAEVLTVSDSFADLYRKNEITQIRVNKNGISESVDWQPKDTGYTDKVVCAHVGGMSAHKGYFLLKMALEELQPKNIALLVVDHSKEEGYRLQSNWGQVPVTFIGRLSQSHVVELYRQIDVLFAPSTWPESYGLVTREAAACGCWVVASNMGGIGEDVLEEKSGFVIEPTLDALATCLEKIDKTPAKFKDMAHPPVLRRVAEQVNELADFYKTGLKK